MFCQPGPVDAESFQRTAVLHGLGGVGKTQTALRFAWERMKDFAAVMWVSADTKEKLEKDYASAARLLTANDTYLA